jgi:hypothetical protein
MSCKVFFNLVGMTRKTRIPTRSEKDLAGIEFD